MNEFIFNNLRFELLDEEIIHIEKGSSAGFLNENTFFIPSKTELNRSEFFVQDNGDYFTLFMNEYYLVFFKRDGLKDLKVYDKYGSILYTYKRKVNSGELPSAIDTPAIFSIHDNPRMVLPSEGYSSKSFDKKESLKVEEKVDDVYLLLAKGGAAKLRELYVKVTGRSELVRFKTLGFWNSRYYKYNEESAKKMIDDHKAHDIALDNMVIDTDWRKANDIGIGYDIDTTLFPDMKRFFKYAHTKDVEIMFNDHPEPVKDAEHVFSESEVRFREEKLTYLLSLGLDYWWYDRNWITCLKSPSENINPETMGQYLFTDITKHYFESVAKNKEIYKRPIVMSNVDNVLNGTYLGIKNSASHRYPFQWTGDIQSSLDSLSREVKNLIKGCSSEITYINADIGGHVGNPSKEEYIRWMQFGAFSPIFRVHATNCVIRFREPWNYDEETLDISRKYINMRYRLIPLLYSKAHDNYETGEPLFKELGYNYKDKGSKNNFSEYLLANDILISPFSFPESKICKKDVYVGKVKASFFNNTKFEGKPVETKEYDELNLHFVDEAPIKELTPYNYTVRFEFKVKFKEDTKLIVASDDGATVYVNDKLVHVDSSSHALSPAEIGVAKKNEVVSIRVDYYQYEGGAQIYLASVPLKKALKNAYLPKDEWIDAFSGREYKGETKVRKDEENLLEMPLFIRKGSIIPLVKEKNRVLDLDYSKFTLDVYPSLTSEDHQVIYEDDNKTTAYKYGKYRKTYLDYYFDHNENAGVVHISKAIGDYENKIKSRHITLRFNILEGFEGVTGVTINGESIETKFTKKNPKLMPFSYGKANNALDNYTVEFDIDLDKEYFVKFYF